MIPEFFQSPEPVAHFDILKSVVGLLLVLFASFVGVEIRLGNEDEDK